MATKTYEIKVGTTELTGLTKYEVQLSDLWADAGRNMAGDLKATFIGRFPKITIGFSYLTEAEMQSLLTLISDSSLSITWWFPEEQDYKTGNFYKSDFKFPYWNRHKAKYEPWELTLIAFKKLT